MRCINSSFSADPNHRISRDYGVLIEDEGIALRGLFIIDPKGVLRYAPFRLCLEFSPHNTGSQMTVNDLPVGRSVEETLRLVKAFQFTVSAYYEYNSGFDRTTLFEGQAR